MKRSALLSAHKAARVFLNFQRNHAHGEQGYRYSSSTIQNATHESSCRLMNSSNHGTRVKKVDLEIISRETIKPSSPTPHNLRTFNLSAIDQLIYDVYTPMIYFLPNSDKSSVRDVLSKRLKNMKDALSETLTRYYPLAGKFKDSLHIECNDEGVNYMEARINQTLEEFLRHPDDQTLRELFPESPHTSESSKGNYAIGIQVNLFSCGGIGVSTSASHKIFDIPTYSLFMKAWAAAVRGSPDTIPPCFKASKIFPNQPFPNYSAPSKLLATKTLCTKRFGFDPKALALLKTQPVASSARPPTRTEATTSLIWKVAAKAGSTIRPFSPKSPHALLSVVNFRKRVPYLPENCFGNLLQLAAAICFPKIELELPTLMGEMRKSIADINSDSIESMKGEIGKYSFDEILRNLNRLADMTEEGDCIVASSLLNLGIYDLDFGWGKPVWFYVANAGFCRFLVLTDTLKGGGVEATVTLSPDEMEIFERDPELLEYATIDPSPLQYIN